MSDILKFPSICPDGVYRLRNAGRTSPNLYLEYESDTQITPQELDAGNTKQQWTITAQADDIYRIVNVNSKSPLSVITYTDGGETKQRLGAGGSQQWNVEPRGDEWVIGVLENGTCIDLAVNNVPIIWERNNLVNQHWVLEIVDGTGESGGSGSVAPGVYGITNVGTKADLCVWTGRDYKTSAVRMWPTDPNNGVRKWNVESVVGGVEITYVLYPPNSLRWLQDGPEVAPTRNTCRLVPVPNTEYFHIALTAKADSKYLADTNTIGTADLPAASESFDANDQRQQWYFTPWNAFPGQ